MTTAAPLELTADHRRLVLDILEAHLPREAEVWVFGSRAKGAARRYSDLDLVIDAGRRLSLDETAVLSEAFSECDLPYRVDVVDWQAVSPEFRSLIAAGRRRLARAPTPT